MGRNKHNALASSAEGRSVKERHQRSARDNIAIPRNLAVLPEKNIKSKHQSYFQFFENKDRKDKKLEFEVRTDSPLRPSWNTRLTRCRSQPTQILLPDSSSFPVGIPSSHRRARSCRESQMLWCSLCRYVVTSQTASSTGSPFNRRVVFLGSKGRKKRWRQRQGTGPACTPDGSPHSPNHCGTSKGTCWQRNCPSGK